MSGGDGARLHLSPLWVRSHCCATKTETLAGRPGITMTMGSRPMTHQGLWRAWVIRKAKRSSHYSVSGGVPCEKWIHNVNIWRARRRSSRLSSRCSSVHACSAGRVWTFFLYSGCWPTGQSVTRELTASRDVVVLQKHYIHWTSVQVRQNSTEWRIPIFGLTEMYSSDGDDVRQLHATLQSTLIEKDSRLRGCDVAPRDWSYCYHL